jgi:aspartyl-tRNA synthetase
MPYAEAIARYGSDKPDLRCGMPIQDVSAVFAETAFAPFREALAAGGAVRGFVVAGAGPSSRRELDELVEQARQLGAAGLVWVRQGGEGAMQSPAKAAGEEALRHAFAQAGAGPEDLLLLAAGPAEATSRMLGQLRLHVARRAGLLRADQFAFTWVVDFPLFEWDENEGRFVSMHHPFTSPAEADLPHLTERPGEVRARAYDLVLNGSEIGGGSIRIHDPALQAQIFRLLRIGDAEARERFGFFLDALEYGAPPHGGIALGLDRIVAILAGENSIREVIAFPKTAAAVDLMAGAPSPVDERQLRELYLQIRRPAEL